MHHQVIKTILDGFKNIVQLITITKNYYLTVPNNKYLSMKDRCATSSPNTYINTLQYPYTKGTLIYAIVSYAGHFRTIYKVFDKLDSEDVI